MSVLSGCHASRNMITIEETVCPQCGSPIEFFMRDGMQIAEAVCEKCGAAMEGTGIENNPIPSGKII